ncbi:hypothetical protein L3Q82_011247, partial [Scortum barcoo]
EEEEEEVVEVVGMWGGGGGGGKVSNGNVVSGGSYNTNGKMKSQQLLDATSLHLAVEAFYRPNFILYKEDSGSIKAKEYKSECCETTFTEKKVKEASNTAGADTPATEDPQAKLLEDGEHIKIQTVSYEVEEEEYVEYETDCSSDSESEDNFIVVPPRDHLGLAIFSMLCCFWPLGIAAFYFSQGRKILHLSFAPDPLPCRPQHVRLDNHCSSTITINTGVPQGCVMSPFLYSLLTHDCRPADSSNTIIKFADDTTVIGLIKDSDEAAYRGRRWTCLAEWRNADPHTPIHIKGMTVERVNSFKFLGVHISEDLTWTTGCSKLVKKAHQRLFFLRTLRKNHLSSDILVNFYRCTIESILTSCITVWYGSCSAADRKALQRVVKAMPSASQRAPLPSIEDIYRKRCLKRAGKIIKDSSHPAHRLFTLLPSGKRYRSARTKTTSLVIQADLRTAHITVDYLKTPVLLITALDLCPEHPPRANGSFSQAERSKARGHIYCYRLAVKTRRRSKDSSGHSVSSPVVKKMNLD